jgi:cytochrome c-type biogenesis protein CcmH
VRGLLALLLAGLPLVAIAQASSDPDPRTVVGEPSGQPLSGERLEAETERVASLLRCPSCQGLSVQDSPTEIAQQMRAQVRDMLGAGFTEEQILGYFERSYGEFVRLQPPLRGINWLVWLAPVVALLVGGFVVARTLRAPASAAVPADHASPGRDTLPDDPELARYVRRVREIAYGWPGGDPPGGA